jgi:hypothetical protein
MKNAHYANMTELQAEAHGQTASDRLHRDRRDAVLRLQRLSLLPYLTEIRGGSDVLLGAFPA